MASGVDLNQQQWCDIIFEGRNKEYGAYALRRGTAKRYNIALICIVAAIIAIVGCAGLYQLATAGQDKVAVTEVTQLSKLKKNAEVKQKEKVVKIEKPQEIQAVKSSVKFTAPVIKKDEEVDEKETLKNQEDLMNAQGSVSIADVKGNDEENGKDIADLKTITVQAPPEEVQEEKVFDVVEQMPDFPGGMSALMQYLNKHIKYPVVAEENGIQGRVIVTFVVEKNGSITDVQVVKSVDPSLDKEAVRVVKSMPNWIPGKQNGSAVRVKYTLPVTFRLQ
ncbi:MAG: energy transducer TonB [Bacteroidaceae bacterium]|nr:energy transducer TonB [Bacteroidaceae bacterium]